MTTAIVGLGNIGSRVASHLVKGGEPVVLASREKSSADAMAAELGELASSATVADAVSQADTVIMATYLDDEKTLISQLSGALAGKVVIDPANPVGLDSQGSLARTLPQDQSAASVIAPMLPDDAHYAKAFGTVVAEDLGAAARREPDRAVMFYAADDQTAAATAERLISASGFDPVRAGGIDTALRIEAGGDLNGRLLTVDEARTAM